jgi:hypothetical protein
MESLINRIIGVGAFKIGNIYMLNDGYYKGQLVKLLWISVNKPIYVYPQHFRQVQIILINERNKKINAPLNHLSISNHQPVVFLAPINPFKKLSNKNLIKLAVKTDNRKVLQEYIRRFKKKPKFKR